MADAVVSKTSVQKTCEFDSRLGHQEKCGGQMAAAFVYGTMS